MHIIPSVANSEGGPSRAVAVMERALTLADVAVVTVTTDHGLAERGPFVENIEYSGRSITRFYARKRTNFYKVAPSLVPWLWTNVKKFDVVHIHTLFSFTSVAGGLVALLRGVPYVIRPLGTLTNYGMSQRALLKRASFTLVERRLLERAAAVHFTSTAEWDEAKSLNITMRPAMIALGVEDIASGARERLEADYPSLNGRVVILYLSRLDPKKNIEALIDAVASCRAAPVLLVAGAGDLSYVDGLKCRAASLRIASQVIWLGHVDGKRKADALARADIFALPSFSENFGIAAVEAMLARLPCVLGEGVAIAKQAAEEGAAFAVAPHAASVAGALEKLVGDPALRTEMGRKARQYALRHYSADDMATSLKALYTSICFIPAKGAA